MDDMKFLFFIVPGTFAFIGFVFTLIFGPEIMQWYAKQGVNRRSGVSRSTKADEHVESVYVDRPSRTWEKEALTR